MTIRKQEFYEGAALHQLSRGLGIGSIRYDPPFFTVNGDRLLLIKYSAKGRSPWGFTFTASEQSIIVERQAKQSVAIGLVCGADGIVALSSDDLHSIAAQRTVPLHVACHRRHGEHYEVSGPDGTLSRKVPPSAWSRLLSSEA